MAMETERVSFEFNSSIYMWGRYNNDLLLDTDN